MHCDRGTCATEATYRLLATLGEAKRLPSRHFEPFPGDPLYELWKAEDQQGFHSWQDAQSVDDNAPLQTLLPEGQPMAGGRWQAAHFARRAKAKILELTRAGDSKSLGRCLEWDNPFYAVKVFGGLCERFDSLIFANKKVGMEEKKVTYRGGTRVLYADVLSPPEWMPEDYGIVVCFFVLEHIPDPYLGMRNIARLLRPGGFILLGAPFMDGVHGCPDDFFRYTPEGLRRITQAAGLEVLLSYAPGGEVVTAGGLFGMYSTYWAPGDLLQESDSHPTNVFLLAWKPRPGGFRRWRGQAHNYSGAAVA